jgi:hypothetical protein
LLIRERRTREGDCIDGPTAWTDVVKITGEKTLARVRLDEKLEAR